MKDLIDSFSNLIKNLKEISLVQLFIFAGIIFLFVSFCPSIDFSKKAFHFQPVPVFWHLSIGIVLILLGLLFSFVFKKTVISKIRVKPKGYSIQIGTIKTELSVGRIENLLTYLIIVLLFYPLIHILLMTAFGIRGAHWELSRMINFQIIFKNFL